MIMTTSVEAYLIDGCMRCDLGATPQCKVHTWISELKLLRSIVVSTGLQEESKWGMPCYTFNGKNVLMLAAFKAYCTLSFFKGSLLADEKKILNKPGENSQAGRLFKFTSVQQILAIEDDIKAYIFEAIEVEKAGLRVEFAKNPEPMPEELEQFLDNDPVLKEAFEALTPGRQRSYILYVSATKTPATRIARIEKNIGKILNGEGLNDKYSSKKKS